LLSLTRIGDVAELEPDDVSECDAALFFEPLLEETFAGLYDWAGPAATSVHTNGCLP